MLFFIYNRVLFSARSTKGVTRLSSSDRALVALPDEVKEVLIGILLGDAHIVRRSPTANSRLVYAQTAVKHKEYFDYVLSYFVPFCVNDYTPQSRLVVDNRTKKTYSAISFTTMQLPCFNVYRELFYDLNKKKIVPSNISELLTPRSLAFWIMDDGSLQNKGLHLNTYGFNSEDVLKLKLCLENLFGNNSLKCSIHKHPKGQRIYI